MKIIAGILLLSLIAASAAVGQTTIYWKRDHIYDSGGTVVAVATPKPADTTAPTTPTGLGYVGATTTSISIAWTASTDSGGSDLAGYLIYRGNVPVGSVAGTAFTDVGLTPATNYSYKVVAFDNAFNYSAFSSAASIDTFAAAGSPSSLVATASSTSQVNLSWSAPGSGAPHHYGIWRFVGGTWTRINTTSSTTYADTTVSSNTSYLYAIAAENSSDTILGVSNFDLATAIIFTDDPITIGSTVIKAVHLTELRTAVNAVRTLAGLTSVSWTDSSLSGAEIKAIHVYEPRDKLSEARNVLGLAAASYTDTGLSQITIKKAHIDELRQQVK